MSAERTSMRRIREILRLKSLGLSGRAVARSLGMGPTTVSDHLGRARAAGLDWETAAGMTDSALEDLLFSNPATPPSATRPQPDWQHVHSELRRKHVTLMLLWQEYKAEYPGGYQYSQFCTHYRRWAGALPKVWMHQDHKAGEKLFVDYSGDGIPWVDRTTGEVKEAQLFVAVMGASNYTYAEVTENQQLPSWVMCLVHAFDFLGGVPALVVPDQTREVVHRS